MSQHAHAKAANATVVEGRHCRLLLTVTQRHLVESGVGGMCSRRSTQKLPIRHKHCEVRQDERVEAIDHYRGA